MRWFFSDQEPQPKYPIEPQDKAIWKSHPIRFFFRILKGGNHLGATFKTTPFWHLNSGIIASPKSIKPPFQTESSHPTKQPNNQHDRIPTQLISKPLLSRNLPIMWLLRIRSNKAGKGRHKERWTKDTQPNHEGPWMVLVEFVHEGFFEKPRSKSR